MVGDWEISRLGNCVTHQKGFAFKSADYRSNGHPIVRVSNFTDRSIDMAECSYLDHEAVQQHEAYKLMHRDAVIATVGSWPTNPASVVGKTICVPEKAEGALLNQNAVRLRTKANLDQRFLFYMLKQQDFQTYIVGTAQGSASQASITLNDIFGFEFQCPPLAEQKSIAAVLGALDDKIELNRRMNATLEAMARALFQSWFVDFDPVRAKLDGRQPIGLDAATAALFPAHFDHISEGVVPSGWRATTLSEAIEIFDSKRIPLSGREREARQGKYPYHGAASVMDYVDDFLFDGIYALMGEDGSVVNEDGTPVLQYAWGKFWVNNHAHVLRGKNGISTEHLLLHLKGSNIAPFVNGAVQPKLNQGNMNRIPFMLPPPEIGQAFARTIEPLFAQIRASTEQSRTLATLRDTLLPKLLSGELRVAQALALV